MSQTTSFLAMESGYSAKTAGAACVIENVTDLMLASVNAIPKDQELVRLADYGTADGGTSFNMLTTCVDALLKNNDSREVQIVWEDMPRQDYNAYVSLSAKLAERYQGRVTSCSVPISFYQVVLPRASVDVGFSATAMHWLQQTPVALSDSVHMAASKDEAALAKYREAGKEALKTIMKHRARELRPGGRFVLVNFGVDEKTGHYLGWTGGAVNMFKCFHDTWKSMKEVSETEVEAANFPQIYRRESDYTQLVADVPELELVSVSSLHTACPYRKEFQASGNKEEFCSSFPHTLRTWSSHVFEQALSRDRSEEERSRIVETFWQRIQDQINASPEDWGMDYIHHVVVLKRK